MRAEEVNAQILVLHTIAAVTNCSIGVLLLRALCFLRQKGDRPPGFFLVALILVVASLTRSLWPGMVWLPLEPPMWLDLAALTLISISIMAMPVVMAMSYLNLDNDRKLRRERGMWLDFAMALNAGFGSIALMVALVLRARSLLLVIPTIYIVAAVLLCAKVELVRNVQVRHRGLTLFSRFTALGLVSIAVVLVIGYTQHIRVRRSFGLMTLGNLGVLMMVAGVLFAFANLRLADLVVKRALRVDLLGCASLLMWFAIVGLNGRGGARGGRVAEATLGLVLLTFIALGMALGSAAMRALDEWIDRWLFEQPNFDVAMAGLWTSLLARDGIEDVFRSAELFIQTTLSLAAARIITIKEWSNGDPGLATRPGVHFVQSHTAIGRQLPEGADVVLPLYIDDVAAQYLVLARGRLRPHFTAMELRFVERVAGQVQIRVGTLVGEQRRMQIRQRERALQEELTQAELRALRAQINPHFLFNSLNTIADLTLTSPERAEEMTLRLAAVFRYVLISTDRQFTSVKEELDFSRSYLDIEEARFERRLKVLFDTDPLVLEERVPTLLLQPLVENALKHGIGQKRSGGTITIVAKKTVDGVLLMVSDTGKGLEDGSPLSSAMGTRTGIANVKKRLKTAYDDRAVFTLRQLEGGGTQAMIQITDVHVDHS